MPIALPPIQTGRADRLNQQRDVRVIALRSDTPYQNEAWDRIARKQRLREMVTAPISALLDDIGMAARIASAREAVLRSRQPEEERTAEAA
jgi:hypothetical protein